MHKKLSTVLWIVLLVIVGVASTTSIRWVSPALHIQSNFGPSRDLSDALLLGLFILITAALAPFRGPTKWSRFLKITLGLVVFGIAVSSFLATDKSLAFYAGAGMLIGMVLMLTTWKLADRPWKIQLALIVITALGVIFAAKAWIREKYEIDQTWKQYVETRDDFWAKQGKTLDDPSVKMFEARMLSRDNGGFFFHGNLGGMYLATVLFVSLALVVQRFSTRRQPYGIPWLIGSILLTLFILSALVLTMSKGAILAALLTLVTIAVIWRLRSVLARHFRAAVIGTVLLIALVSATVIGHGLARKTLPTLSMAYRWQYWVASYAMFKDHPFAGVGLNNFGHYYQQYKLPEAEEEITSPHNFVVQGFTELGFLGGLGFMLLPLAILHQIAKSARNRQNPKSTINNQQSTIPSAPLLLLAVTVGTFGLLFVFNQSGLPGPIYLLAEYLPYVILFPVAFVLSSLQADRFDTIENAPPTSATVLCLTGALVTFILGDIVNFSLEEPSMQFLFFFLAGLTLAAAQSPIENKEPARLRPRNLAYVAATIIFAYFLLLPAIKSENIALESDKTTPISDPAFDPYYQELARLAGRYPYDAHLAAQAGKQLIDIARANPEPASVLKEAITWFQEAQTRAPEVWEFCSQQGQCWLMLADLDPQNKTAFMTEAEACFEKARTLAPRSKTLAMTLGLIYAQHVQSLQSDQTSRRQEVAVLARKHLQDALDLDQALPAKSIRHLSNQQIQNLKTALDSVKL